MNDLCAANRRASPAVSYELSLDSVQSWKEDMRTTLIGILLCLVFVRQALPQVRQPASQLDLMPMPRSVQLGIGRLVVTSSFSIAIDGYKNELLERAAQRLNPWPVPDPENGISWVAEPQTEAALAAVRRSVNRGPLRGSAHPGSARVI